MLEAGYTAAHQRQETPFVTPSPRPRPNPQPQPRRAPKAALLLIVLGCFLLSLVVIAQYSYMVILHRRLSMAEMKIAELVEEYRALELEAARLGSLSRIETLARTELGMREPEQGQVKVLTAGQEDGRFTGE